MPIIIATADDGLRVSNRLNSILVFQSCFQRTKVLADFCIFNKLFFVCLDYFKDISGRQQHCCGEMNSSPSAFSITIKSYSS